MHCSISRNNTVNIPRCDFWSPVDWSLEGWVRVVEGWVRVVEGWVRVVEGWVRVVMVA